MPLSPPWASQGVKRLSANPLDRRMAGHALPLCSTYPLTDAWSAGCVCGACGSRIAVMTLPLLGEVLDSQENAMVDQVTAGDHHEGVMMLVSEGGGAEKQHEKG
jgi:hypothetical protein